MKYADYIEQIEIESLWSGTKHILWNLDRKVNILSGINGVGKSTILSKVIRGLAQGGEFPSHMLKGVRLRVQPSDAKWIRYDVIRSFDRPMVSSDSLAQMENLKTELDWQLFVLQRKYLDYQVNVGNRIIEVLQRGGNDATEQAQSISQGKNLFQNIIDNLFKDLNNDGSTYNAFFNNRSLRLFDAEIDMICKYMPKLQTALDIKNDTTSFLP